MAQRLDVIVKEGNRFSVFSEGSPRKRLGGPYRTRAQAQHRLRQIEWFKSQRKDGATVKYRPPTRIEAQMAKRFVTLVVRPLRHAYKHVLTQAPKLAQATRERMDSGESHKLSELLATAQKTFRGRYNKAQIANVAKRFGQQAATEQRVAMNAHVHDVLGVDVPERDPEVADQIDAFAKRNADLITRIPDDFHEDIADMTKEAMVKGRLGESLKDDISDRFGVSERHARLIARDQLGKLVAGVNHHRMKKLGVSRAIWHNVQDERVRGNPGGKYPKADPSHWDLEGTIVDLNDEDTWPEVMDGEVGLPGQAVQCVPGDTEVSSEAPVTKLYRRWYRGEGTVLKTEQGHTLTTTPNHPVLTTRGWLPAHDVQIGDYVIEATLKVSKFHIADRENRNTSIEEAFSALSPLWGVDTLDAPTTGFHGDMPIDQKVDVIRVDGCLRLKRNLPLSQHFCENLLARAYDFTLGSGTLDLLFVGSDSGMRGCVRGANQLLSIFLGSLGHAKIHSLAAISRLKAIAQDLSADDSSGDAEVFCNALDTPPVDVELCHHVARVIYSMWRRAVMQSPSLNTLSAEQFAQNVTVNTETRSDFCDSPRGEKFLRVTEKFGCELATHVYNLETECGWYVASGLVIHNCRCWLEPILDDLLDDDDDDDDDDDEGEDIDPDDDDSEDVDLSDLDDEGEDVDEDAA